VAISLIDFDVGSLPCTESFSFGYSSFFLFLKRVIFPNSNSIWNMVDEEKPTIRLESFGVVGNSQTLGSSWNGSKITKLVCGWHDACALSVRFVHFGSFVCFFSLIFSGFVSFQWLFCRLDDFNRPFRQFLISLLVWSFLSFPRFKSGFV